ncbi:hypothetical protein [Bacillus thuringiensis]|uniref:hypothetical protein n=1 Tax=Bacillus thuringiensis TaxID=1428 RepID=UPI000BFD527D|nr:hypothetical protein [Bacillus thuringiensis]PGT90067.1 hypothetical protein COD17_09970 [Bacillus thuringiensis]
MEDKIKARIKYLDKRIKEFESRVEKYKEPLTTHGHIEVGKLRGSIVSKEMEISFLESLVESNIEKP